MNSVPEEGGRPALWPVISTAFVFPVHHLKWVERVERGRSWIIVQNETSGVHVRVEPWVWRLVQSLDGKLCVADMLDVQSQESESAQALSELEREQLAQAIATLEQAGIVVTGLSGTAQRQWARSETYRKLSVRQRWLNPLAIRIPLHDPDRWMSWLTPRIAVCFSRPALYVWYAFLLTALYFGLSSLNELMTALSGLFSSPQQWWSVVLVWPLLKLVHELGHALAVHRFGGRVHEWGMSLLVLMPVPYVDASDASLFTRRHRLLVGAAGMLAEMTLAAAALVVWCLLEVGLLRDLVFAVLVAGSVNTVLFNANPLLRFDGYYLLQDAVGLPNLASRASRWWLKQLRFRLFKLPDIDGLLSAPCKEQTWYAGYGALALTYRYFIVVTISLWLMDTLPLVGVGLALFALWPLLFKPVFSSLRWLATSAELAGRRATSWRTASVCSLVLVVVIGVLPLPSNTRAVGVVAVQGSASLVSPEAGQLVDLVERQVTPGDLLARIKAPVLEEDVALLEAERSDLEMRRAVATQHDALEAQLITKDLKVLKQREEALATRIASLEIRADRAGRFVPAAAGAEIGQLLQRGDAIGQIVDGRELRVQAVVREHHLERVRDGVDAVRVRLAESVLTPVEASLIRQNPSATRTLPSPVLAGPGVGGIAVASVEGRVETIHPVFQVEVSLPEDLVVAGVGERAYVTFLHPPESLAKRWWRMTRQLFLERLSV